ncbi:MAG: complex I subunit 5 family protein [Alkalispirochaeta sp.]
MVSPVLFIAIPLATAFLIVLAGNRGAAKVFAVLASGAVTAISIGWILPAVTGAGTVVPVEVRLGGVDAPLGIALVLDSLGVGLTFLVSVSLLLVTIYSLGYIPAGAGLHGKRRPDEVRYYAVLMLLGAASFGLILTRDLFNLFVFYEILCISSYILVAYEEDDRALEASMKYMLLGSVGSLLMLAAIGLAYRVTGSLAMSDVAAALADAPAPYALVTALLFLFGMGLEAAIFPVNAWLPDAHSSAPSSISAVLSGFVIELALVVLVRVGMTVFAAVDLLSILPVLAIAGILVGEIAAWAQRELKRTLAYSSIGQIGIILFALSLGTRIGAQAALGHLFMHAGAKSVLFLVAGYFILRTGSHRIGDYRGLAARMPVSATLFAIAALSLLGVPPLFGFFTKFRIVAAAAAATGGGGAGSGMIWFGIAAILFGTVLEGAYLFRIVTTLFDRTGAEVAVDAGGATVTEPREVGKDRAVPAGVNHPAATRVPAGSAELDLPAMVAVAVFVALLLFGGLVLPRIDGIVNPAAMVLASLG